MDQARRRNTYELVFRFPDDTPLTVMCRKPSFLGMRLLVGAERLLGVDMGGSALSHTERVEALSPVVRAFAGSLLRWNLRDGAVPVPATLAGVEAQDYELVVMLVTEWYRKVVLRLDRAESARPADFEQDDEDDLAEIPFAVRSAAVPELAAVGG